VTKAAIEVCTALLEKNRHKRPSLEKVLAMEWFADFKDASKARSDKGTGSKFTAYAMTSPDSPKIQQEIDELLKNNEQQEEKKAK
jgi:hypothetical protein